jgi:hypothetical protein
MFVPPARRRSHSLLHCQPCRSRVCVTPARRQLVEHARVCSWAEPCTLPARHAPSLACAHALAPVHLHASRARSVLLLSCTPEPSPFHSPPCAISGHLLLPSSRTSVTPKPCSLRSLLCTSAPPSAQLPNARARLGRQLPDLVPPPLGPPLAPWPASPHCLQAAALWPVLLRPATCQAPARPGPACRALARAPALASACPPAVWAAAACRTTRALPPPSLTLGPSRAARSQPPACARACAWLLPPSARCSAWAARLRLPCAARVNRGR